ncbi:phage tail tape measure protein [Phytobacter sp. V91]|uniref:phage tail tape measure protein n=1 Tax=Phytobacter sp. V91 TaxID=3369425 RepID=UPI003F627F53
MADRLTTEILINLAGNLTAKARQYGANMSEFARTNERAMSIVRASTAAAGRGLDALGNRYTGLVAGVAGGAMLRNYSQLDRRLTRMGITAGKTREEIAGIFQQTQDVAIKFGVDTSDVQAAFEEINARSGDLDLAIKNSENIGMALAASGSEGATLGGLIAEYKKLKIEDQKQTLLALDGMNRLGKEGAFELKDAAEKLPASLSMYSAVGGKGVKGAMDVMAVAESAMDVTANKDKAATAVENFIRDLQNPKVVKALKQNGIDVFDKNGSMRALPQLLQEVSSRSARGGIKNQRGRLTDAGFNQDSMDLIAGATGEAGAAKLKTYMGIVADGQSIIEDAAYASKDFTSATQRLSTALEKFTNRELAKPVQELADALNSVDKETVNNWLEVGKNIAIATGGIVAARKVFQVGKGAWDLFGGGKSKGIPKGVADVFGSGVMPVYVVNMGVGGFGGGPDVIPTGAPQGSWFARVLPFLKTTAMGATLPFLDASPNLTDEQKAEMVQWAKDRANGPSVWSQIADFFTSASSDPQVVDPRPWVSPQQFSQYPLVPPQLRGEIRVVVEGDARVKSVSSNQPGVTISEAAGKAGVGQN